MPVYKKQSYSKQDEKKGLQEVSNDAPVPLPEKQSVPDAAQDTKAPCKSNSSIFNLTEITPEKLIQGIIYQEILDKPLAKRRRR